MKKVFESPAKETILNTKFLDYEIVSVSVNECIQSILQSLKKPDEKTWLACLNPHSYVEASNNMKFGDSLKSANWLIPDGIGIVLGARFLNKSVTTRITGFDIFESLNYRLNSIGSFRVFLLGSTQENLEKLEKKMKKDFPLLNIVGCYSPPFMSEFDPEENLKIRNLVNSAKPNLLWVGLGAPKQEIWIYENIEYLDVQFCAAVGAVFDFYIGNVKRSNRLFQKAGLEWLPRLLQQPKRLWKRTFISAPKYILRVIYKKIQNLLQNK